LTELKTRNASFEDLSARTKCIEEQVKRELEALREEQQQKTPEVGVRYRHSPRVQAESNLRAFGPSSCSEESSNHLYTQKESFASSAEPPQVKSENFYSRNHRIVLTSSKQEPVADSFSSEEDDDGNVSSTEEVY